LSRGAERPADLRLPPEARLKTRRQFLRVQDRGQRVWGRRFIFAIQPGSTRRARLGITVSRKVGKAVVRNRIKRWVREAFRQHPELFERPVDVVITAKRDIDDFSYHAIEQELLGVLGRFFAQPEGSQARRGRGRVGRGPRRPKGGGAGSGGGV
jgi:ribonuclease P protein component